MPVKKHRKNFKVYHHCFTGEAAVLWLHGELQKHPQFGPKVTKTQTFNLLMKFMLAGIFKPVKSKSCDSKDFKEGQIYQ
jgi:hypothetical protein